MSSWRLAAAILLALTGCRARVPAFSGAPDSSLVDEPLALVLHGLPAGAAVWVSASFHDDLGQRWASRAEFTADPRGTVDLATARPASGGYREPDAMGLLWSMRVADSGPTAALPAFLDPTLSLRPLRVLLEAGIGDSVVAADTLVRQFLGPGVDTVALRERGMVGTLFVPAGPGPHAAALVVTGSSGGAGWARQVAAVLGSRGRAALALAYFDWRGADGLPNGIIEIPLEYFSRAIDWMLAQPRIGADDLGAVGISKGGELVLVLAAHEPRIRRVVGYVPSSVVWEATRVPPSPVRQSSWSVGGRGLPFVPMRPSDEFYRSFERRLLLAGHQGALRDRAAAARAEIPVERIAGAVLLISGAEDEVWPSAAMADRVVARLRAAKHAHEARHLRYERMGHVFSVPFLPTPVDVTDRELTARIERAAWVEVLRFLGAGSPSDGPSTRPTAASPAIGSRALRVGGAARGTATSSPSSSRGSARRVSG